MVIDSSAVLAILGGEAPAQALAVALDADKTRLISAPTLLECSIVLAARHGDAGLRELDLLVHRAAFDVVPFDEDHYEIARNAYRRFGKGRHAAGLNYGDCMTYALAASTAEPVLFVGDDFSRTDLAAVSWR
jgi:ribonuclease VapC